MARIAIIFVLLITVNAILGTEATEFFQHGSKIVSTHNYYPNSTLNLVTLGIVNGKKYFFASQRQSWESWYQASYFCNAHGMDLASIETQHENELIMEQISKLGFTSETYWISGHKNGRSSWLWINGDFIIFSDWGAGEPSDPETDHCLSINNGSWYDRLCELETGAGFICEERETFEEIEQRSIYASDTLDLVTLDSTTGQKYFFATATASWFEASYFCNAYGMDLVTIETQKENDLIVAHIESIGVTPAMTYWTSAHTIGRSTWLWINGEIVIYADWADQQPQNPDVNSCMFISGGDWYNDRCEIGNMEAFICESRQLASERSIDIAAEITYYPADLMNLVTLGPGAGKQYLTSNQAATWFEASYFCNAHGMDLVSIETEEENAAIMSHITSIGHGTSYNFASGHKIGRTTYLWINGEYMQYADWAPGQPIDPEFQSCLIVSSNDWYGRVCYYDSYFICEERTIQSNSK